MRRAALSPYTYTGALSIFHITSFFYIFNRIFALDFNEINARFRYRPANTTTVATATELMNSGFISRGHRVGNWRLEQNLRLIIIWMYKRTYLDIFKRVLLLIGQSCWAKTDRHFLHYVAIRSAIWRIFGTQSVCPKLANAESWSWFWSSAIHMNRSHLRSIGNAVLGVIKQDQANTRSICKRICVGTMPNKKCNQHLWRVVSCYVDMYKRQCWFD